MAKVNFKRVLTSDDVENLTIEDGSFIITKDGKIFTDYENERISIGGTPDTEVSITSTNSVENKAITNYVDMQTNSINSNIGTLPELKTTNKDNLVNAINELSVDYVVEQGTNDIWTYRKWNSGIAECWCNKTLITAISNAWGSIYDSNNKINEFDFPSNLFIEAPILSVVGFPTEGNAIMGVEFSTPLTQSNVPRTYITSAKTKTSSTYIVSYRAIGKWK